ncbi:MAG: hypothetical protein FWG89_04920 [Treponema sp.]|nr:hypothetical protein [Treponema sp.]
MNIRNIFITIHRTAVITVFFFCVLPAAIHARDIEVIVEDNELGLPLEGAVISLRSGERFICDENGIARVQLPDERQTIVHVSYPGYDDLRLTIPASPPQSPGVERFSALLRLRNILVGNELVIEASRPEASETRSGRSVAVTERDLTRTAEIGIIEDVMSSVKLLPGVGYTGMFGALPSIRGSDPGDMMAVFDGFYLERPFHWVGAVSIFDPKMVSSARLSHGVFSARYGHTVSGLLEITSRSPSSTETELETAISSSAASLNLSLPLSGKGGILFMGKVTYWDVFIWAAQGLSRIVDNENLDMINAVSTSPYIRSAAVAANYRFNPNTEWRLNGFFGSDGVGAAYDNVYDDDGLSGSTEMKTDYDNYQGFIISGITSSPNPSLALRFTGGIGFNRTISDNNAYNDVIAGYNQDFLSNYPFLTFGLTTDDRYTVPGVDMNLDLEHTIFNAQARADIDWDLGRGYIAAFGVQGLYSLWSQKQDINMIMEIPLTAILENNALIPPEYAGFLPPGLTLDDLDILPFGDELRKLNILMPRGYYSEVFNQGVTTSVYGLLEYISPNQRFAAELGLRLDHLFFIGRGFNVYTPPALSPRLNLDFNILKNRGILDSLDVTLGTGLFSSMNTLISFFDGSGGMDGSGLRFNRSWTSIIGAKADWGQKFSFNIEGYYKYVFNRAYITAETVAGIDPAFLFDGIGHVAGFDFQLQKLESRYWDGWISYTFTWARYHDPSGGGDGVSMGSIDTSEHWYYPSFHRFHNANIVLNIKPSQRFHIATRFGFASGQPRNKIVSEVYSYPVLILDENGDPKIIQKYRRDSEYSDSERGNWSLPWDIKFSFFIFDRKGRVGTEIYLAAENLMSLFYNPKGNPRFNSYTGQAEEAGSGTSGFDLPIPMVSFGFKWRY